MAKYFVGGGDIDALSKFTRLHGTASLSQVDDGGQDAIAVTIPTSNSPSEHVFAFDGAGQFTNGDILVRYRMSSAVGSTQWDRGNGAFYRGLSSELTNYSSGARRVALAAIYSQVSGSASLLASTNPGIGDNSIYKWYRSNFNGSSLKLKVWTGTFEDQPGTWTHEITNSTISAAGWVGLFAAATGSSSTVTHYWTHIGISDDPDDPAPHEPISGGVSVSGAMSAQAASVSSSVSVTSPASVSGTLVARAAETSGQAVVVRVVAGNLEAQSAAVAGATSVVKTTAGALQAQPAQVSGVATNVTPQEQYKTATFSDFAFSEVGFSGSSLNLKLISASGDMSAQPASVVGSASFFSTLTATGELSAQAANIQGSVTVIKVASGALLAQPATLSGLATIVKATIGQLEAAPAQVSGSATVIRVLYGDLAAGPATVQGAAVRSIAITLSGDLAGGAAVLSGAALQIAGSPRWEATDEGQAAGWGASGEAQVPGWGPVDEGQGPGWSPADEMQGNGWYPADETQDADWS